MTMVPPSPGLSKAVVLPFPRPTHLTVLAKQCYLVRSDYPIVSLLNALQILLNAISLSLSPSLRLLFPRRNFFSLVTARL